MRVIAIQLYRFGKGVAASGEALEAEMRTIMQTGKGVVSAQTLANFKESVPLDVYLRYLFYLASLRLRPNPDLARARMEHKSYPIGFKPVYTELGTQLHELLDKSKPKLRSELLKVAGVLGRFPFDANDGIFIGLNMSNVNSTFSVQLVADHDVTVWQIAVSKVKVI